MAGSMAFPSRTFFVHPGTFQLVAKMHSISTAFSSSYLAVREEIFDFTLAMELHRLSSTDVKLKKDNKENL